MHIDVHGDLSSDLNSTATKAVERVMGPAVHHCWRCEHIASYELQKGEARMSQRKIGSDATNALLWAAFAMLIIVGVLYTYGTVKIKQAQSDATTMISSVTSEIRAIHATQGHYQWLTDTYLVETGAVPVGYTRGTGETAEIVFEGQAALTFAPGTASDEFNLTITWDQPGRQPSAVCRHLAAVPTGRVPAGTLGEQYQVIFSSCDIPRPTLTVTYFK